MRPLPDVLRTAPKNFIHVITTAGLLEACVSADEYLATIILTTYFCDPRTNSVRTIFF